MSSYATRLMEWEVIGRMLSFSWLEIRDMLTANVRVILKSNCTLNLNIKIDRFISLV